MKKSKAAVILAVILAAFVGLAYYRIIRVGGYHIGRRTDLP